MVVGTCSDSLNEEQTVLHEALCAHCSEAAVIYPLAQRFMKLITERQADVLNQWLIDALAWGISATRRFYGDFRI